MFNCFLKKQWLIKKLFYQLRYFSLFLPRRLFIFWWRNSSYFWAHQRCFRHFLRFFYSSYWPSLIIWAATWQNGQNGIAPSEDSDQPGHPPSLIRVFAVRMKKAWVLGYPLSAQRGLWSDWADAQADLSLRWAHTRFAGFVMSRLIY